MKIKKLIGGFLAAILLVTAIGWEISDYYAVFMNWIHR